MKTDVYGRRRFRDLLELNDIGCWEWEVSSGAVVWSEKTYEILGLVPGETTPSYDAALGAVHRSDRDRYLAALAECMDGKDHYELQNKIERPDGTFRVVIARGRVVRNPDGEPKRMFGSLQDITAAVEAEEAVREREQEHRLMQMTTMESLGNLASGIAHDFNNALTPIILAAHELVECSPSAPITDIGREILGAASHAAILPEQLRAFGMSREKSTRGSDINDVVRSARQMLERTDQQRVAISLNLSDARLRCAVDPRQIEQLCVNLVLNSMHAMPDGGTVTITTRAKRVAGQEMVCLRVTDTGNGMRPEHVAMAFEPFFTTKLPGLGTGLGLAMAKSMALRHDGDCDIISEVGVGTTVSLWFPRCDQIGSAPEEASTVPGQGGDVAAQVILLVDDEPLVLRSVARILRRRGHVVFTASGASESRRLMAEHGPQVELVITDVHMPGTNGPKLVEELTERWPDLAVLFMTGNADNAQLPGRSRLLDKPFEPNALFEAISAATYDGRARDATVQ